MKQIYIEQDHFNDVVRIYYRYNTGNTINTIHSLGVDGVAQSYTRESGCVEDSEKKPYITIPRRDFDAIKEYLGEERKAHYQQVIEQLIGELKAKEQHIKNLNDIFDKTLNKI